MYRNEGSNKSPDDCTSRTESPPRLIDIRDEEGADHTQLSGEAGKSSKTKSDKSEMWPSSASESVNGEAE